MLNTSLQNHLKHSMRMRAMTLVPVAGGVHLGFLWKGGGEKGGGEKGGGEKGGGVEVYCLILLSRRIRRLEETI